ncbi:transporter substrate-binding domain-containing protein [Roseicyclus sp. F158]|uniref:Transporter substrate-binding domain-containing protein n=1 Tax=Tropicimonas omnivorans TaxID=3075590 RepID=A0ABU3DIW7_9RHOB|nr:transporter substrate-binding domain-containing protein [Roseicyclus sp. F158]MDT0683474.1 transporter substrate-binding domain-containing protein [Roseicyclus sp. F158]
MKTLLLAAAAATLATSAMAQDVVRMGTEGAYPPYNFINDDGEIDGFEREVGDELCTRAGLTCEWVSNDWDSIIPNLTSGNYDTIIAGMSITDERDEVIDFTDPYFPPAASAYASTMDMDPMSADAVVAAQTNTIQAAHVAESGATLLEFATPDEAVAAMRNGEADAIFADKDFLVPIVDEDGDMSFVGEDVGLGDGIGIGLRESDDELEATFNEAIASMKEDGTLNTMITEWFGEDAITFE